MLEIWREIAGRRDARFYGAEQTPARARGVVNFKTASHCRCVIIKSWSERVLCDKFAAADVILGFCERAS
jgi:hypothetical protein